MSSNHDHFRGLKVEVVSQDRALDLYDDPEAEQIAEETHAYRRILYVEAVTGATFSIRVTISNLFDLSTLSPNHGIQIKVAHDGRSDNPIMNLPLQYIERRRAPGGEASFTFDRRWQYCKTSGRWTRGNTVFSEMAIEETDGRSVSAMQIRKLGSIEATVCRVQLHKPFRPRANWIAGDQPITAVSEKMIKGKAITNVITLHNIIPEAPTPSEYDVSHLDGEVGKKLIFEVRYRSRQNLQSLGCIPRTPTPEPDLRAQNRALREQLALLERSGSPNIKAESSRAAAIIKRDREDSETLRGNKRPRGLGPEIVDLTGGIVDLTGD